MSLKERCFAKSCQNARARPATKQFIKWSSANKPSFKKIWGNPYYRWQKRLLKSAIILLVHIKNAISFSQIIQLNISCSSINETKTILKHSRALVSLYIKPKYILKRPSLANSMTNCGFSRPNCTKRLDGLVHTQSGLKANKHSYSSSRETKACLKMSRFDISF